MKNAVYPRTIEQAKEMALNSFEAHFNEAIFISLKEAREFLRTCISEVTEGIDVVGFAKDNPEVWDLPNVSAVGVRPTIKTATIAAINTSIHRSVPELALTRFLEQFDNRLQTILSHLVDMSLDCFEKRPGPNGARHGMFNSLSGLKLALETGIDRDLCVEAVQTLVRFRNEHPELISQSGSTCRSSLPNLIDDVNAVLQDTNKLDEIFPALAPSI